MSTTAETTTTYKIAVIGAGGKMGMRVSNNLVRTDHTSGTSRPHPRGSSAPSTRAASCRMPRPPSPTPTSSCSPCPTSPSGPSPPTSCRR